MPCGLIALRTALLCSGAALTVSLSVAPQLAQAAPAHRAVTSKEGWQYTQWGMTPAQVVKASQGQAAEVQDEAIGDLRTGAKGVYSAGKYSFASRFAFKESGLWSVDLDLQDSDEGKCVSLSADLEGKYGSAKADESGGLSTIYSWRDEKSGSQVVLIDLAHGQNCTLNYRALHTKNATGL